TASGYHSLYSNTIGSSNTANGFSTLSHNTTGSHNTANGFSALSQNTTGFYNTAIGYAAIDVNTTGSRNTALGCFADVSAGNFSNATAIGYSAVVTGSNKVRIGNASVNSIGGQVGWTTFSDGRYKKDIQESVPGLAFINGLRPVTYTVNVKGLNEFYEKATRSADKPAKAEMNKSEEAAAKIVYNGFVAQEVELAAKKLNFQFSGVDVPETKDGLYGLRYDNFISPMVKAMQEQSKKNDEKDSLISDLQNQINDLKALITKGGNGGSSLSPTGYLKQNAPNPFRSNTVISYYIPENAGHAQIRIVDINGRLIKTFNAPKGEGQIAIRSDELFAGTYSYTLFVNNRTVDTKQMVLLGNSK
ncbi:MAG TPA: T9SS type A sorting domain-containing protein, partial [Flavitalea sp.]|nr:T9SS type A sorting domain-containing protein [Flavitalea sp.]